MLATEHNITANYLQIKMLRPFPVDDVCDILADAKKLVVLEDNYMGQLGLLIAEQTGIQVKRTALKYDGRPFSEDEVVEAVSTHLTTDIERLVLSHP